MPGERYDIDTLLDVTIVYPENSEASFWDFLCGRFTNILIDIKYRKIPAEMTEGDYLGDQSYRTAFQQWLTELWREKDQTYQRLQREYEK